MKQFNVTGMSCAACSARVEKAVSAVPEARLAAGTQLFLFRGDEYRIENRGEQAVRLFCLSADDAQN